MRRRFTRDVRRVLGLLLVVLLLSGCQAVRAKSAKVHRDWSRGTLLGQTAINGTIGLSINQAGDRIYGAWVVERESFGTEFLHFISLDRSGNVIEEKDLNIGVDRPLQVRLVVDANERIHLAWVDRLEGVRRLFYASVDASGRLTAYPKVLSPAGLMVENYDLGLSPEGTIEIVWSTVEGDANEAGRGAGLYHVQLDGWGHTLVESYSLDCAGFDPDLQVGRDGTLHLVWQEEPDYGEHLVQYATLDPTAGALSEPVLLTTFPAPLGLSSHRPILGLAGDHGYVFWSLERRGGGLTPPKADTYYVSFPLADPAQATKPELVAIPGSKDALYSREDSLFNLRDFATTTQGAFPSQFIYMPATLEGHYDELPVAFAVQLSGRTKAVMQIVLTIWDNGQLQGYQIMGATDGHSTRPVLLADSQSDLHVAWLDTAGFGALDIYYAATSPEARANLNRITTNDVLAFVFGIVWGVVQAMAFVPMVFTWMFVPVAFLSLYMFIRAEGGLDRRDCRIALVVAILMYLMFKYLFRPQWLGMLSLPAQYPAFLSHAVTYAVPFLISGIAGVITWLFVKKRLYSVALAAFAVFAGSDAVLTLLVYIPAFLAE